MFIKRAKSRPSLRARETDDAPLAGSPLKTSVTSSTGDHEDSAGGSSSITQDETEDSGVGSVMERKKAKNKEKKFGKGNSRLSFGMPDEGGSEGTPFKQRKSLLSQSIKLPSTPTSTVGTVTPNVASGSSATYSQEYLSHLKANTPSRASKTTDDDAMGEVVSDLSGEGGLSEAARMKYGSLIQEDTGAGIPDDATIVAARMKRQAKIMGAKRGLEGNEDYIALGNGQIAVWDDGEKGPHPDSRLMREEDEGEDGDEDMADYTEANERLFLGKQANKSAARRLKGEIGELIDDREAEDEDDEETREWEEAQVRRGGTWEPERPVSKPQTVHTPAPIPIARPLPTISGAQARVAKALAQVKSTQAEAQRNLEIAIKDLALLQDQEQDLRKEVERVEGKREWVEEFRGWVEMLGHFLEEKVPRLNDIEADAVHHLKERAEMINKRRKLDDEDDLSLFLGAPRPAADEVDELGRSREVEAGPSSAVRKARRTERQSRRTKRQTRRVIQKQQEDGYSTDSSLADGDADDYEDAQRELRRRTKGLLEDVRAEDFRDPHKGLAVKFADWRSRYEEEYLGAFGGLSMVQAWEFYARSEMVGWDPLRSSKSLDSFDWFHSLHEYSRPPPIKPAKAFDDDDDMDVDDELPLGPDGDLVIEMVSKTVVPLLTKQFENGSYDPYSTPQTRRAIDLVEVVADLTGKTSPKYVALLKAILGVFNTTIVDLATAVGVSMGQNAIPPPGFDPEARVSLGRFVRKRVKLIKNVLLWRREAFMEVREYVNRIVGEVLRPVLERQWEGGGGELAQEVAAVAGNELRPDLVVFLREGPGRRAW